MRNIFTALAATLAITTTAFAHSNADKTTPKDQSTVESVEAISLRFDEPTRITFLTLTGPDDDVEITRETGFDPVTEIEATLPETIPTGDYNVEWRGLSADGHPIQGSFAFTVDR